MRAIYPCLMLTLQSNVSLRTLNTFGIDVSARYFVEINSEEDLQTLLQLTDLRHVPRLILGGGSNVLFTRNFEGLVVKNCIKGIEVVRENAEHGWVRVGAGEIWHELVLYCVQKNWGGLENLSLIPGTVGAAPMQNIGAYGVEIKETFEQLEAIDTETGRKCVFDHHDCHFGYRESIFKHQARGRYIITHVTFRLNKTPVLNVAYGDIQKNIDTTDARPPTLKSVSDAVIKIRRSKLPDPAEIGNAGSFFKNPEISTQQYDALKTEFADMPGYPTAPNTVKVPAGWLIEQAGWKGKRFGSVGVHARQALVLVNYGGGTGGEIKALSEKIQASVYEKYGIELNTEVNFV